jgi:hypothetical protein
MEHERERERETERETERDRERQRQTGGTNHWNVIGQGILRQNSNCPRIWASDTPILPKVITTPVFVTFPWSADTQ